jgi:hypothetical protein
MANTVTSLSYANTFGHWLAATDALIAENNVLAKDNYVKDSGTIYLSEGTLNALQSNGNVIVQKALMVQGVGSYATVQNDLTVERQGLFTNTELSIDATGSVEIGETLTVHGAGYGLQVDNDASVGGDLVIGGNLELSILESREKINTRTLSVTGSTYTNKLQSNNEVVTDALTANSNIYTSRLQANTFITTTAIQANTIINAASVSATTGIYGNLVQANTSVNTSNASIVHTVYTKTLQANSSVNTSNASIVHTLYANHLVANTIINSFDAVVSNTTLGGNFVANTLVSSYDINSTNLLSANNVSANNVNVSNSIVTTGAMVTNTLNVTSNILTTDIFATTSYSDTFRANAYVITPDISVSGTTLTGRLQANSSTNTSNSSVVNTSYTKFLVANTLVTTTGIVVTGKSHTNTLQANSAANTETLSVTQRALVNRLQANTSVNTEILSVSTTALVDKLQANSSVNTSVISVTGNTYTDVLQANSSVNTATLLVTEKIDANGATVFVNNLETLGSLSVGSDFVINGTTIYNSDTFTLNASATEGQFAYITVNRGQTGANAEIRWNESLEYWEIYDTNVGNHNRILTDEHISDALDSTNSLVLASAYAANTLNDKIQTANTYLKDRVTSAESFANSSFLRANSSYTAQNTTAAFANAAFRHANAAFESANNVFPQITPSFNHANAAFDKANTVVASIKGTTGSVSPSSAGVTLKSNNGIVIFATNDGGTGNTLSISTSQDLRTSASPTFAGLALTTPLQPNQGGTGTTSYASLFGLAITAAAGSGADGKVLGTDGAGGYSWVTGGTGGGGGTQPGSRISSSRLTYSGDDTTTRFTTPTFTTGTQLRAYINGVRQLDSEYSAFTSNSKIIFTTPPVTGDSILIEVDGYAVYEYFANNIVYGPASGDMVGSTIQAAIDNLETRKMPKIGGTFTGRVDGLTMPTTTSNTVFATTQFVNQYANAGYTLTHSITGNAGTVTNGVYTSNSYDNPTWLNSIAPSKLNAVIPDNKLADVVTAAAHGSTANTISLTVDAKGRITAISNSAISITKNQISDFPTFTDATNASNITSGTLANARLTEQIGVTVGTYGGTNKVGKFTVNSKGIITAAADEQIVLTKSAITDFPTLAASATTDTTNAGNISSGTLPSARLPSGLAKLTGGTDAAFTDSLSVAAASGTGKIVLGSDGYLQAYTDTNAGTVYLNKAKTRFLAWDGTKYSLIGAPLEVNGSALMNTTDNYTIKGLRNYVSSNPVGTASQSGGFAIQGNSDFAGTNMATMSFHRPGAYAINMGLDADNFFRIGGWSDGLNTYRMTLDTSGNAVFRNNVTAYSDERLKTNVKTITNALDTVLKMRGVTYERIESGVKGVGVIAQEMKEVLPEVVMEAATEDEFMSVAYGNIVGVLIEAIKELKAEIEVLKGQNK